MLLSKQFILKSVHTVKHTVGLKSIDALIIDLCSSLETTAYGSTPLV